MGRKEEREQERIKCGRGKRNRRHWKGLLVGNGVIGGER